MIVVAILVLITSTVTLVLTLQNFNSVSNGINVSNMALDREAVLSTARLLTRSLFNLAMGYDELSSALTINRFKSYSSVLNT